MTAIAITQPPYLGWTGFWSLANEADTLVLLDTVAISRQSWQTRNRVRLPNGSVYWLSIPCSSHLGQRLDTVTTVPGNWNRKHWATIQAAYQHAAHFHELAWLEHIYANPPRLLADLTTAIIRELANQLGITTEIIRASDLPPMPDGKIPRLEAILEHFSADVYLTTPGASYLRTERTLGPAKIAWHTYTPTTDPPLSVIHDIATDGLEETRNLIRQPTYLPSSA